MKGNTALNIDEHTLHAALDYADVEGIDLSDMVEQFLQKFIAEREDKIRGITISDEVKALAGILPSDKKHSNWRERKRAYLQAKH